MSPAFVPEPYLESVISESAWEAVVRALLTPTPNPLMNMPTDGQISILDKSRLIWGGLGAGITAPRSLQAACGFSLSSLQVSSQQHTLDSIQGLLDCTDVLRTVSEAPFVDYAAIRSLVRLVCEAFNIPDFPKDHFREASAIANDLLQDTAINSGEAMLQVWTTMQLPILAQGSQDAISQLFARLTQQPEAHQDIRRKALDITAMLHLGSSNELVECALKLATAENRPIVKSCLHPPRSDHEELCVSALDVVARALNGTLSTQWVFLEHFVWKPSWMDANLLGITPR
ncbi:hypothetical protein FRC10_004428 [Ceratobasidium sp. 414]|nr:hypothetical protein FRC10_004428 [Ceratobasidium sp. 414]